MTINIGSFRFPGDSASPISPLLHFALQLAERSLLVAEKFSGWNQYADEFALEFRCMGNICLQVVPQKCPLRNDRKRQLASSNIIH